MSESTVKFQFVYASAATVRTKIEWPVRVQALIIKRSTEGVSAKEAFDEARLEMRLEELPKSYTNKNAASLLWGLKTRFLKRLNKDNPCKATLEAAQKLGLIQTVDA